MPSNPDLSNIDYQSVAFSVSILITKTLEFFRPRHNGSHRYDVLHQRGEFL